MLWSGIVSVLNQLWVELGHSVEILQLHTIRIHSIHFLGQLISVDFRENSTKEYIIQWILTPPWCLHRLSQFGPKKATFVKTFYGSVYLRNLVKQSLFEKKKRGGGNFRKELWCWVSGRFYMMIWFTMITVNLSITFMIKYSTALYRLKQSES